MKKIQESCLLCSSQNHSIIHTVEKMNLVKCGNCKFIYLRTIPDESVLYESYHEWTGFSLEDYCKSGNDDSLKALWNINQQRVNKIIDFRKGGDLLDIGCGSGAFMLSAREYGFNPQGIDVSNKAIEFINDQLDLQASTKSITELEKNFEIITLWHVLEHFLDPVSELKNIHQKLENNGILVGEVPNWNSIKFQLSGQKWEGGNHPLYHRSFFTPNTLQRAILEAGFSSFRLVHLPYTSSGKKDAYYFLKKVFNLINRDAFLTFIAWK